jgi:hypothetical protein
MKKLRCSIFRVFYREIKSAGYKVQKYPDSVPCTYCFQHPAIPFRTAGYFNLKFAFLSRSSEISTNIYD